MKKIYTTHLGRKNSGTKGCYQVHGFSRAGQSCIVAMITPPVGIGTLWHTPEPLLCLSRIFGGPSEVSMAAALKALSIRFCLTAVVFSAAYPVSGSINLLDGHKSGRKRCIEHLNA